MFVTDTKKIKPDCIAFFKFIAIDCTLHFLEDENDEHSFTLGIDINDPEWNN